jgi:Tol biopolymer transport system component
MNRKIIIIISICLIVVLVVAAIFVWKGSSKDGNDQDSLTEQKAEPKIVKVVDEAVVSPIPSFQNNSLWYFKPDGRLLKINLNGSGTTEYPLPALNNSYIKEVLWSPVGSDFILISVNGSDEQKIYYNSDTKKYTPLSGQIKNVAWLPDGKRIAYIWQSNDNAHQQIAVANADGTGYRIIKDVFWSDLKIYPLSDGKTALLVRGKADEAVNKIYSVNLERGEFGTLIEQGKNVALQAVPKRNAIVYAKMKESGTFQLYFYDFATKTEIDTGIGTSTENIIIDPQGKYLIASAPKSDYSGDEFVKYNLDTLKSEIYFTPNESIRGRNLTLVGQSLYFVNSKDSKLYRIEK